MPEETAVRSTAIVIVNLDGVEYLPACLDSVAAIDYPQDQVEVIVVDNASTDGSRELLADRYPSVKVLPQDTNTGFAAAVNIGVAATEAECVALLNNDMRVDPNWLRGLYETYDPDNGVVCTGGVILSWDGELVDFTEGCVNFYGIGDQVGFGRPVDAVDITTPRDLLFACGGSMLISREAFTDVGGFDEGFFAYYEDVDLGWRLWLQGYQVRLAPASRTFHLHQGTSSRFPEHQRMALLERNALRTIIKNYDDRHLHEVLGPALLLLLKRGAVRAGLDSSAYKLGGDRAPEEVAPRLALAHMHAAVEILDSIDEVLAARAEVQSRRRRSDQEIINRFGRPLNPILHDAGYLEGQHNLVTGLHLDETFEHERATQVVIVVDADGGSRTTDRLWSLAADLGRVVDVVVASRMPRDPPHDAVRVLPYDDEESLLRITDAAEVVVAPAVALSWAPELGRTLAVLVIDLAGADDLLDESLNTALETGDLFVCESAHHREFWTGVLRGRGRLAISGVDDDRPLVASVPDERTTSGDLGLLRDLALAPWKWRALRERGRPYRAVTDDVRLLLDLRNAEVSTRDAELDKRGVLIEDLSAQLEAHIRDLGSARQEIRVLRDEAGELRKSRDELLLVVEHQANRLALLRRTPLYPLYRALRGAVRRQPPG